MWWHKSLIPALKLQKQVGLCEFEFSLVHTVNSRTARVVRRKPISKQPKIYQSGYRKHKLLTKSQCKTPIYPQFVEIYCYEKNIAGDIFSPWFTKIRRKPSWHWRTFVLHQSGWSFARIKNNLDLCRVAFVSVLVCWPSGHARHKSIQETKEFLGVYSLAGRSICKLGK